MHLHRVGAVQVKSLRLSRLRSASLGKPGEVYLSQSRVKRAFTQRRESPESQHRMGISVQIRKGGHPCRRRMEEDMGD